MPYVLIKCSNPTDYVLIGGVMLCWVFVWVFISFRLENFSFSSIGKIDFEHFSREGIYKKKKKKSIEVKNQYFQSIDIEVQCFEHSGKKNLKNCSEVLNKSIVFLSLKLNEILFSG